ncbi:MAG TPA: hypothetical protein DGT21_21820 [Armatimonadetes bacterium]|jgi:hypothetical protein|nr:hypothetical protein [Armatimonadota bacterium]
MRRHRPEIIFALLLLLTPALVWVYWDVRLSWEIRAEWNRIREEGYPTSLDDLTPGPIPDAQNAAIGYMRAMRQITLMDVAAYEAGASSPKFEAIRAGEDYREMPTAANEQCLREALDSETVRNALREAIEASRTPACVFPCAGKPDWDVGDEQHFGLIDVFGQLLGVRGRLYETDGDRAEALECYLALLRMSRHALSHAPLGTQATGYRLHSEALAGLAHMTRTGSLSPGQAAEAAEHLDAIDPYASLHESLCKVRAAYIADTFLSPGGLRKWCRYTSFRRRAVVLRGLPCVGDVCVCRERTCRLDETPYHSWIGVPWRRYDQRESLVLARTLIDISERPPRVSWHASRALMNEWKWGKHDVAAPATAKFAYCVGGLFYEQQQAIVKTELCRAVLAAQAFYRIHGVYPNSLAELSQCPGIAVPTDPFTEGSFGYKRLRSGCIIYSFGPDGIDDGGLPYTGSEYDLDKAGYDIPWWCDTGGSASSDLPSDRSGPPTHTTEQVNAHAPPTEMGNPAASAPVAHTRAGVGLPRCAPVMGD